MTPLCSEDPVLVALIANYGKLNRSFGSACIRNNEDVTDASIEAVVDALCRALEYLDENYVKQSDARHPQ